jgi:hypothetical protein
MGIGLSGPQVQAGAHLGERALGQREVGCGLDGGPGGVSRDDRVGERRVLAQRPLTHLRRIRLGVEAQADLPADARGQVDKALVVGRPGDRLVQGVIGDPRVGAAAGPGVPLDRGLDRFDVGGVEALGGGPRDERLDQAAVVK